MGLTYIEGTVTGPTGLHAKVQFLVDSGATYTVLPLETWQTIGLAPERRVRCRLADGTALDRKVGECHIRVPQGARSTPVILGEEDDQALLGMVTLEELGLVLNPFTRTLLPMQMVLT